MFNNIDRQEIAHSVLTNNNKNNIYNKLYNHLDYRAEMVKGVVLTPLELSGRLCSVIIPTFFTLGWIQHIKKYQRFSKKQLNKSKLLFGQIFIDLLGIITSKYANKGDRWIKGKFNGMKVHPNFAPKVESISKSPLF